MYRAHGATVSLEPELTSTGAGVTASDSSYIDSSHSAIENAEFNHSTTWPTKLNSDAVSQIPVVMFLNNTTPESINSTASVGREFEQQTSVTENWMVSETASVNNTGNEAVLSIMTTDGTRAAELTTQHAMTSEVTAASQQSTSLLEIYSRDFMNSSAANSTEAVNESTSLSGMDSSSVSAESESTSSMDSSSMSVESTSVIESSSMSVESTSVIDSSSVSSELTSVIDSSSVSVGSTSSMDSSSVSAELTSVWYSMPVDVDSTTATIDTASDVTSSGETTAESENQIVRYSLVFEGNCSLLQSQTALLTEFLFELEGAINLLATAAVNEQSFDTSLSCEPFNLTLTSRRILNITLILESSIEIDLRHDDETLLFRLIDMGREADGDLGVTETTSPGSPTLITNSIYILTFLGDCRVLGLVPVGGDRATPASDSLIVATTQSSQNHSSDMTSIALGLGDDVTATETMTTKPESSVDINQLTSLWTSSQTTSSAATNSVAPTVAMVTHLAVDDQTTLSTVPTVITSAGDEQNTIFGQTDSLISEVAKSSALPPDTTAASQPTVIATGIMTTNESTSQEMLTTRVDDLQNFSTAVESMSDSTSSHPASSSVTETINVNMTSSSTDEFYLLRQLFEKELQTKLGDLLNITSERIYVNYLMCGSVVANITIVDTGGASFDELLMLLPQEQIAISLYSSDTNQTHTFLLSEVEKYEHNATFIHTTQTTTTEDSRKDEDDDDEILSDMEFVIVIICSVIGGVLLLLLITFICYKCIGARNRKSFALGDTPAAQYDMEDFSLTKMNRPKPIYTDRGLIINTDLNVPPRPLSGYSSPTAGGAANSNHRSSSEQLVESGRAPHNAGHDNLSFSSEDMLDPSHVTLEESALQAPPRPAASSRM